VPTAIDIIVYSGNESNGDEQLVTTHKWFNTYPLVITTRSLLEVRADIDDIHDRMILNLVFIIYLLIQMNLNNLLTYHTYIIIKGLGHEEYRALGNPIKILTVKIMVMKECWLLEQY
jgi:hypothetical protein